MHFTYVNLDGLNLFLEDCINASNLLRLGFAVALELRDRLGPSDAPADHRLLLSVLDGLFRARFLCHWSSLFEFDRFIGHGKAAFGF